MLYKSFLTSGPPSNHTMKAVCKEQRASPAEIPQNLTPSFALRPLPPLLHLIKTSRPFHAKHQDARRTTTTPPSSDPSSSPITLKHFQQQQQQHIKRPHHGRISSMHIHRGLGRTRPQVRGRRVRLPPLRRRQRHHQAMARSRAHATAARRYRTSLPPPGRGRGR